MTPDRSAVSISLAPPRPRRPFRPAAGRGRLRTSLLASAFRTLAAVLGPLSWAAAQRCGRAIGGLCWVACRRHRRRSLEALAVAFPRLSPSGRRRLGRACFRHLGMMLAEGLHLLSRDCAEIGAVVDIEGWEHIEQVRASGRPLILITGHCGNWELLGAAFNCRGLGMAVVARPLDEPDFQEMVAGFRARFGTRAIERGREGAARQLLTTLRRGGVLGMLIDQDTRVDGVWVPFFGRPAFTPVGAVKIALRQGAAVIPTFIERLPGGRHRVRVLAPVALPDDPREATALLTRAIEEQVRRVPEQWVWMHRRWRRQPPADRGEAREGGEGGGDQAAAAAMETVASSGPAGEGGGHEGRPRVVRADAAARSGGDEDLP
jgi:KDO2-lipid IV(A) lauroyltransferase